METRMYRARSIEDSHVHVDIIKEYFIVHNIMASHLKTLAFFCAILCMSMTHVAAARVLLQQGGCSSSPGQPVPESCQGGLFSGNQWDNDEIECNFGGRQLKCDLDEDWFSDNDVDCQLEGPGDDIEFKCNVDSNCNINCDENELAQKIPAAYLDTVTQILNAWKPDD